LFFPHKTFIVYNLKNKTPLFNYIRTAPEGIFIKRLYSQMKQACQQLLQRFASFWWGENGLSALLVLLLLAFMLSPLLESKMGKLLSSLFYSMILLTGVATMSKNLLPRVGAGLVALVSFFLTWLKYFSPDSRPLLTASALATLCYLLLFTGVIMRQVFRDGPVNVSRVDGAIAAYILIGLSWGTIYSLIELHLPGSLHVTTTAVGQDSHVRQTDFTYFSFVTLTTLGYGDITPIHPTARMFVIIEALIGQLFPATLLARLVSLQTTRVEKDNDR
jgi:voltage-gated potassium channel Kch